jgi:hypothetical protein
MAQENFMMVNAPLVTQGNASAGHVAPAGCRIELTYRFSLCRAGGSHEFCATLRSLQPIKFVRSHKLK